MNLVPWIKASPVRRFSARVVETVIFGTALRERAAKAILRQYYASVFRRQWRWLAYGTPHFALHSRALFGIFEGAGENVYSTLRGFLSAEIIDRGDMVLDIGCGDGALTKRFYAARAAHVDAIDLEQSAVDYARKKNAAPNISYWRRDAVSEAFPSLHYDVIVFDGAIGHFSRPDSIDLLRKIALALSGRGIFCGSESLGLEGHDHLQHFDDVEALRDLLLSAFKFVRVKEQQYSINKAKFTRREVYWRATNREGRLEQVDWR